MYKYLQDDKLNSETTVCSLILDEMSIKKQIEFVGGRTWGYVDIGSSIDDDNLECATEALVLMVVAVNGSWKIPIAYFLIKSLTGVTKANIVKQALIKLAEVGVTVVSLTCDGPNVNFTMIGELGAYVDDIYELQPYFLYPSKGNKIFVILDACHMIKLLRNCWATSKVLLDDNNEEIDFGYIEKLQDLQV